MKQYGAILLIILIVFGLAVFINNNNTKKTNSEGVKMQEATELKIEDIKIGDGAEAKSGDSVKVNYVGTLTNGNKFDSSYDRNEPFEFDLGSGQVIEGWDKGVAGMKVGGKRKLTIPSQMAYGDREIGEIPANSTLIFEIELLEITNN